MLLPTARVPAPPVGATEIVVEGERFPLHMGFIAFALAFSVVGAPAVAVPAGPLPGGLTASVQLVAAPGDEGPLLSAARRLEAGLRRPAASS
jgi:aspartyl-tRNA(Asn)/glutamyl-tRNA(Gln) amidotransferase subunit A